MGDPSGVRNLPAAERVPEPVPVTPEHSPEGPGGDPDGCIRSITAWVMSQAGAAWKMTEAFLVRMTSKPLSLATARA